MTDRILEIGGAGLESAEERVRKVVDNMVLSKVPGAKKTDVVVNSFPLELEAANQKISSMKPYNEGSFYNDTQGALIKTGGKFDLALASEGYFVVYGPWGEGYTRDGRFRIDKDGRLLTVAGNLPVMGKGGPVVLSPGSSVEFTHEGGIKIDGAVTDTLRVVKPETKDALTSLNGSVFKKKDASTALLEIEAPQMVQGFVESSNVNIIDQMMEMMVAERTFNANTQVMQTRNALLGRAMDLGKTQ